jgi:hypothetical protein
MNSYLHWILAICKFILNIIIETYLVLFPKLNQVQAKQSIRLEVAYHQKRVYLAIRLY